MKIIVDANIVFISILNSNGKIGDLLINSYGLIEFIATDFLTEEIKSHYSKLVRISKLSLENIFESEYSVCRAIAFISEEQIRKEAWLYAEKLVSDIDPKDTPYLAYARHFRCKIWSGDQELTNGLLKKGFKNIINTNELFSRRQKLERKSR